uniref:Uncharacterized protein n=1 Tax=Gouania willdenowi TaxID=441366 RepID=A0A8C5HB61_GOUWI
MFCLFFFFLQMVQKLIPLLVWLLFLAAVCPGPHYAHSRGVFKGRGKGDSNKGGSSHGGGLSKQGAKWAGSAAAGMLGGTGTGYGLGFLGRPKHLSKSHYHSHKAQDQLHHQRETQKVNNHPLWRAFVKGEAPAPMTSVCLTIGHVMPFLTAAWIQYN